ncbi:mannitol dehydrogenase family protein (plasmid) [Rhizobium sp. RCAM05350]|nr:mannitol dehydrogenase family protein [Rhizobium sp. RCAM05350]
MAAGDLSWGICGIGILAADRQIHKGMLEQERLFTIATAQGDDTHDFHVVGSISEYLFAPDSRDAIIERLASPGVRIVSLTVTEGGYCVDVATGKFDPSHSSLIVDTELGIAPSFLPLLVEGLALRRSRGVEGLTVLSCDNLTGNGRIACESVLSYATLQDVSLADWISRNVGFPNTMVDGITPRTSREEYNRFSDVAGIVDSLLVVTEPFTRWVIADDFKNGRPDWEKCGVEMVDDVEPFEIMKIRMLNAAHQLLSHVGTLCRYTYVDEAMNDPVIRVFVDHYLAEEALPTLEHPELVGADMFRASVIDRFGNTALRDTLARNRAQGSDRIPTFLFPVIQHQLSTGGSIKFAIATLAAWSLCCEGAAEGSGPPLDDLRERRLIANAIEQKSTGRGFLEDQTIFGDLGKDPYVHETYGNILDSLRSEGIHATLKRLCALEL